MKYTQWMMTLAAASLMNYAASAAEVAIGQPAPEFTLTDTQGQSHNLSDFKGKFVVLEWINHGCPFVVKHYVQGNMQALQKEFAEKGVVWLSVCSSAEGMQGHMSNDDWNSKITEVGSASAAVLIDEDGTVGKLYGARVTPHMYVINPDGVLVYNGAIDSVKSTDSDDIAGAENYVAAALNQSLAGEPVAKPQTQPYGCSVKYKK
jgi:alkyl hydroperoxide reductase subunit AhpC